MNTSKDEAIRAIEFLDISKITERLMQPAPKGHGWSSKEADVAANGTRDF